MPEWLTYSVDACLIGAPPQPSWSGTQRGSEFETFVDRLLKHDVRSLFAIGVATGGNQWRLAQAYYEAGRQLSVAAVDTRLCVGFVQTMQHVLQTCPALTLRFILADSTKLSPDDLGGPFDAAFIDGDHSYRAAASDYRLADAITSTLIGFHDINPIGYQTGGRKDYIGSHQAWEEAKEEASRYEEVIHGEKQYGIGIIYKTSQR